MNSLIYFITTYFLFSLYPLTGYSYDSILYTETEPGRKVHQLMSFKDFKILHMVKPINDCCLESEFDFRTLHLNGTIEVTKLDYPIPEFNFCVGPSGFYLPQLTQVSSNFVSIAYVN